MQMEIYITPNTKVLNSGCIYLCWDFLLDKVDSPYEVSIFFVNNGEKGNLLYKTQTKDKFIILKPKDCTLENGKNYLLYIRNEDKKYNEIYEKEAEFFVFDKKEENKILMERQNIEEKMKNCPSKLLYYLANLDICKKYNIFFDYMMFCNKIGKKNIPLYYTSIIDFYNYTNNSILKLHYEQDYLFWYENEEKNKIIGGFNV